MSETEHARTDDVTGDLLGSFSVAHAPRGLNPTDLSATSVDWIPAVVPGGVHESLLAAGRIEDPYVDRNEESVRWIEECDWWYRCEFPRPVGIEHDERLRLLFHGLDTVVTIWCNGIEVASHENMFRSVEVDITDLLTDSNELLLRFAPPLADLAPSPSAIELMQRLGQFRSGEDDNADAGGPPAELTRAAQRRKAVFSWGWDFGPRVPSIGIWRPVELVRVSGVRLRGHHIRTVAVDPEARTAQVAILIETEGTPGTVPATARVTLTAPNGLESTATISLQNAGGHAEILIEDAELWWTHDLGTPALYDVRIVLDVDGRQIDEAIDRIGLRTVRLDRSEDPDGGNLFRFVLNGVPVFARGAAWLPPSMLVGSVSKERYVDLVALARAGNMNMLRVWGGGIYEHDAFYRATDEAGVLVWQDFMFACIDYPSDDPRLLREVTLEAEYQVRRLRNRASIALWCGNNEVHMIHGFAYQNHDAGNWGHRFFHDVLPTAVEAFDGSTPYWPGSPWGEDPMEGFMAVNGARDGDRHAWEVWHGFHSDDGSQSIGQSMHFRRFTEDKGKFISEFGIHSAPAMSTLRKYLPQEGLALHSEAFDAHNKDHPKNKHEHLLEVVTGLPGTLEEYVDFTMVSQAEGLKFGIEHYRRRQPHCSGALLWQLNDVWPGLSWSIIDYELSPKAAFHAVKRAFAPVFASFELEGTELRLWVTNSSMRPMSTVATLSVERTNGTRLIEASVDVFVKPGDSLVVWSHTLSNRELAAADFAWVSSADNAFPTNRLLLREVKDLSLQFGTLSSHVDIVDTATAKIRLESNAFEYGVEVLVPDGVHLSDNFFDLRAGDNLTLVAEGRVDLIEPSSIGFRRLLGSSR